MSINVSVPPTHELKPRITVIGVGGAGCNAVNNMIASHLEGVEFIVSNTDAQSIANSMTEVRVQLGANVTQGLGSGAKPEIGKAAADESIDQVLEHIEGTHMLFVTAGMGGGTGTGAAPVIAQAAKDKGILTVGVVTKPFHFEGKHRMRVAEKGIVELESVVDTLIVIPNQNLFKVANAQTTFADAFKMADKVLYSGVRGVTDLMVMPGLINLDFADVRSVMMEMGKAMMGTGEAEGDNRALDAAAAAISNPLLDDVSLTGARGVLVNITGGPDLTLFEVDEIVNKIRAEVDSEAEIINGSIIEPALEGKIRVSIVATALDGQQPESKSVINMVHRIQNRNPGYSDLSNLGSAQSFNFSNSMSNVVTDGANALKLENEIMTEVAPETSSTEQIKDINAEYNEQVLSNQENETEINIEDNTEVEKPSNGLENFAIEEENPELFNSEDDSSLQEFSSSDDDDNNSEEDDLEIPAFLRRQKN